VETGLSAAAAAMALAIEAAAVAVVTIGSAQALVAVVRLAGRRGTGHGVRKAIWRDFGMWLLLGLEFELAADIVRSVVSPSWLDIGQLAAIAAIRTFLNYFLEQDLERTAKRDAAPA
jgi:uncharacterized membrane protein